MSAISRAASPNDPACPKAIAPPPATPQALPKFFATRRAAITGAVAAAVTAAPIPALAAIPDAELLALGERQEELFAEIAALDDEIQAAKAVVYEVSVPPALHKRHGDNEVGVCCRPGAEITLAYVDEVRERLTAGEVLLKHVPRAEEILAASAQVEAARDVVRNRLGLPGLEERIEQVHAEADALFRRMVGMRAVTPAGLRVKARCLAWLAGGSPEDAPDFDSGDWDQIAARSLVRDLLATST